MIVEMILLVVIMKIIDNNSNIYIYIYIINIDNIGTY